jgi:acetyl/propionyl-CoA carboxylase alpha subunit
MFKKVLIANRGEIAARIARTCERLGIATVAVYSDADTDALHVRACGEAVHIGPSPVRDSYLQAARIIEAAKQTGADAIHPGYGLLSEKASFAQAVIDAGLTFIGPTPESLTLFGDKLRARQLAHQAGVRVSAGSEEPVTDIATARVDAERIGYPLIVKAAAGGGGIGMEVVEDEDALEKALKTCISRGDAAFGDSRVYLERLIEAPRHIEVQIFGDNEGTVVALGDRECSIQRRHQKILEESPSPAFQRFTNGQSRREGLADSAVRIAKEAGYQGAGTVEFMMGGDGRLHFLELNARLQVEHAVTEMCTGLDLVELQLIVASGAPLPREAIQAEASGHAMEARICAEDAKKNFMPQPGDVEQLRWPTVTPGTLRIDTAIAAGSKISPFYDSLVAKVIAKGASRHRALLTLDRALAETIIAPLVTNLEFLREVLAHEAFRAGQYDTSFAAHVLAGTTE